MIAVLAVLKAGMAWVPLQLDAPPARIERILCSCNPRLVLISKSTRHIVGDMARSVQLDQLLDDNVLQSYSATNFDGVERSLSHPFHV